MPALYLSAGRETAVDEYNQGTSRPGTICKYFVTSDRIADLRSPEAVELIGFTVAEMNCDWKAIVSLGDEPPTWHMVDCLIEVGFHGALVPSFAPQSNASLHLAVNPTNIVLWSWNSADGSGAQVAVDDPTGELPVDQSSWPVL